MKFKQNEFANCEKLIEERYDLIAKMEDIVSKAEKEERAFTNEELKKVNDYQAEVERIDATIKAQEEKRNYQGKAKKCTLVMPGEKLEQRSHNPKEDNITLQGILRGALLNKYQDEETRAYVKRNLNTTNSSVTVPVKLASKILDMIRNESAFLKSLPVLPMEDNNLTVAKIVKDIEFNWVAEGEKITFSDATFDGVEMKGKTLAGIVSVTDQLIDSAKEVEGTLETAMAKAIATALDKALMYGDDLNGIKGITGYEGIKKVNVAAHDYSSILKGVKAVKGGNFNPSHVVMSTDTATDMAMLVDKNGQYIAPPKAIEKLTICESNNVKPEDILVYDPMQLVLGLHKGITLKIGFATGDFESLKHSIRIYTRCDLGVLREEAFCLVSTTPAVLNTKSK